MRYRLQQIYNTGEQKSFNWSDEDKEISEYFEEFLTDMGAIALITQKINKLHGKERESFVETLHRLLSGQDIYFLSDHYHLKLPINQQVKFQVK